MMDVGTVLQLAILALSILLIVKMLENDVAGTKNQGLKSDKEERKMSKITKSKCIDCGGSADNVVGAFHMCDGCVKKAFPKNTYDTDSKSYQNRLKKYWEIAGC